jgi:hypothetical protein
VARTGSVHAEKKTLPVTDRDDRIRIHLISDTREPVRYRVELNAPYLSIVENRGTFSEDAMLEIGVQSEMTNGQDMSGSVRIFTNLGDVLVSTPMSVRVTGAYEGSLTYDGMSGATSLGTTRIALDLIETDGDVVAQFRPDQSLLFPVTEGHPAVVGKGSFATSDGVRLVMRQALPSGFADGDDVLARAIGRDVRLQLRPGDGGSLDGMFQDVVIGLLESPVTLTGHVHLVRQTCTDGASACTPYVDAKAAVDQLPDPEAIPPPDFAAAFPSFGAQDCGKVTPPDPNEPLGYWGFLDFIHRPFENKLSGIGNVSTSDPFGDLAEECVHDLGLGTANTDIQCSESAPLACGLSQLVQANLGTDAYDTYGLLFAHMLDVPIFVAQDYLVKAVKASFGGGSRAELKALASAKGVLKGPAIFALHPSLLQYLGRADPNLHKGADEAPTSLAGRTLSRLLLVMSTIDEEMARIDAGASIGDRDAMRLATQKKGIQALLEAALLRGIAESWKSPPPELGSSFVDVLTPLDAGFTSLAQGAQLFGVPEEEIPNVYEPGRALTNAEQLFAIADAQITAAESDETTFTAEGREFESNQDTLKAELENVAATYETQVKAACGEAFDLDMADWTSCGKDSTGSAGTLGSKALDIAAANARLDSANGRIDAKSKAILIEEDRMGQTTKVREDAIKFTNDTGQELRAIDVQEGIINAAEKAVEIASHADLLNGGAPLGEAVIAFGLETAKAGLEAHRQDTQTLQDMEIQMANLSAEQIASAATIKLLLVDMAELQTEMQLEAVNVVSARIAAENELAGAKRALWLRHEALDRISASALRDPTARLLQNRAALNALKSRATAQTSLFRAGRGLEYYLNQPIGDALGQAVMNAFDVSEEKRLAACLRTVFNTSLTMPKTQPYTTDVSVRKLLGIVGPRVDEVTGEMLTEGAQLREVLLRNQNLDGDGGVAIELTTTLDPGNKLWSSNVCDDRITQVEAQLVGDFLGDNEAEVHLDLNAGGVLRKCNEEGLMTWSTSGKAVVQAGVNTFGTAGPNGSLTDLAVASSKWKVTIPGPSQAPSNSDLDLTKLDDIVLRIHHQARPISKSLPPISVECLGTIGAG